MILTNKNRFIYSEGTIIDDSSYGKTVVWEVTDILLLFLFWFLSQVLPRAGNIFCKGQGSECFRLGGPCGLRLTTQFCPCSREQPWTVCE